MGEKCKKKLCNLQVPPSMITYNAIFTRKICFIRSPLNRTNSVPAQSVKADINDPEILAKIGNRTVKTNKPTSKHDIINTYVV